MHDYNARSDEKIIELLSKHGMTGYGIFWGIVESLYNNTNVLRTNYERIAYDLHTDPKIVESVINDFGLFSIKDGFFGSASIERRLNERNSKSAKARESINKRWEKYERNTNVSENDTNVSKTDTIKESKGKDIKEIKGERVKREDETDTRPPTLSEIEFRINERGLTINAQTFFSFYTANGWKTASGNPIVDWDAQLTVWEERDKKNGKPQNFPGRTVIPDLYKTYKQILSMASNDPGVWDQYKAVQLPDRPKPVWVHLNDIAVNDLTKYVVK